MNKKRIIITVGVILLVFGSLGAVLTYQSAESGSNFLSVTRGLVVQDLEADVAESEGQDIPVIVAYEPVSKGLSVNALSVRGQELKSLAVRNLSVYGFSLTQEETIPAFGFVVGEAPAENIKKISRTSGVRAVVKNRFISVSEPFQSYASGEELRKYHEVNSLPPAEGKVVCVVDSRAPREPWVVNAVSVRGEKPYSGFWHGVAVAETVHAVAPEADVTVVKTLDEYGTARLSTILKGIEKSVTIEPKADVLNVSLGATPKVYNPMNVACETLEREYGVKIIASSGNTSGGGETTPATSEATLSVGAITPEGEVASYSSSVYDVLAIGNVMFQGEGVKGTSFSGPAISGLTARWLVLHSEVPAGRIDAKESISQSAELFQKTEGEDLPIVKGSNLSEVGVSTESTPTESTIPFAVVAVVGLFGLTYGMERGGRFF